MPVPISTGISTMHADEEDDWLNPPTQGGAADPLARTEYENLASRYSDAGYREGITDGKLSTLQAGFDEGFASSVPLSRIIGQLRGEAAALLAYCTSSQSTSDSSATDAVREFIRYLSSLRRDEILPVDQERIAHEKEHDADASGQHAFELDQNERRDMEALLHGLDKLGNAAASGTQERAEAAAEERKSGEEVVLELRARWEALREGLVAQRN